MFQKLWSWLVRLIKKIIDTTEEPTKKPAEKPVVIDSDFTPAQYIDHYLVLWNTMVIREDKNSTITWYFNRIKKHEDRYKKVARKSDVPWEIIACLHMLESGGAFDTVLHNGELLRSVHEHGTRLVPKGRGKGQNWDWEEAAIDALAIKKQPSKWNIVDTLHYLERFNGLGYLWDDKKPNSPYLWSFSNHYEKGKYVADGKYSPTAVSKQCGAAVLLKRLGYKPE